MPEIYYFDSERKAEGSGLNADNLCIIKIYVKAETSESRSVAPILSSALFYPQPLDLERLLSKIECNIYN